MLLGPEASAYVQGMCGREGHCEIAYVCHFYKNTRMHA